MIGTRRNGTSPQQTGIIIVLVLIIFILLVIVAFLTGLFESPQATDDKPPGRQTRITYNVSSGSGKVQVAYAKADGEMSENEIVTTPWTKTIISSKIRAILVVGGSTDNGKLCCEIKLDGNKWIDECANPPKDKVACAGYVP